MSDVELLAKKRDELNQSVKQMIGEIRGKMNELKSLNDSAKKLKEERDSKNKIVAEFRKKRDALNAEANKVFGEMKKLEAAAGAKKISKSSEPIDVLKKMAKELDWKIQTEHHSIKKDEELRDELEDIELKIAADAKRASAFAGRSELYGKFKKIREEAETLHSLIVDNSQAAKKAHEELIAVYSKIKALRTEIAPVSKHITLAKKEANDVHGEFVAAKKSTHEGKALDRRAKARADEENMRMRAKELLKEFGQGKKLSTEEILIIQEYGG